MIISPYARKLLPMGGRGNLIVCKSLYVDFLQRGAVIIQSVIQKKFPNIFNRQINNNASKTSAF